MVRIWACEGGRGGGEQGSLNIINRWEFCVKSYFDMGFILLCLLCNVVFEWLLQLFYVQKVLV